MSAIGLFVLGFVLGVNAVLISAAVFAYINEKEEK